ncbi:MAG: hypothetical protein ACT4QC_00405 [Planctomycetaceae bacterium]
MPTDDAIIAALQAACGRVSFAAEKLACEPALIRRRARDSERVQQALARLDARLHDTAEAALWKAVLERESWAVKLAIEAHAARTGDEDFVARSGCVSVQEVLQALFENDDYQEFCRSRAQPASDDELPFPAGAD